MTKITMTNNEINRALATAFGCYERNGQWVGFHGHYLLGMPDYVKSLGRKKAWEMAMRFEALQSSRERLESKKEGRV